MGYIGPALVKILLASEPDANIYGIDSGFFAHCLTGAKAFPERNLKAQFFRDMRDIDETLLQGMDAVIHLAAISNDPMGKAFEEVTADVNYRASVKLAKLARKAGVGRFVFASSCSVYGYAEGDARDEHSELNPLTAYARSKIATEKDIEPLASEEFVITSLRFPTACGMSERLRLDLVLNDFVASAVSTGKIRILSDGTPWRPLIDIKDMSRSMSWAAERNPEDGGDFLAVNVGRTEWNYQVRDVAEAVRAEMPHVEIEVNKDAMPDKRSYQVDFGMYAGLAPDHLPKVDLAQSIRELRKGLTEMGFNNGEFRNSDFMRLKVLTSLRERGMLDEELRWQ